MGSRKLLIATRNPGKTREFSSLLSGLPLELVDLNSFPEAPAVEETGSTYAENAVLKARAYSAATQIAALADDSGLEVEALGGRPGVLSARYAGEGATDSDRVQRLLKELSCVSNRRARFVCVIAVAGSQGELLNVAEGICEGSITLEPRGKHGFGFDPVFVPAGHSETFGELAATIKGEISHRARAIKLTEQFLKRWLG